jgi:hypothetical protein
MMDAMLVEPLRLADPFAGRRWTARGSVAPRTVEAACTGTVEPGTVWLVGGTVLSSPAVTAALGAADCVLCDAGLPPSSIAAVRAASHYVELVPSAAEGRERAQRRCIKLAGEGWRVLRLFRPEPVGLADAVLTASLLTQSRVGMHLEGLAPELVGTPEIEPQAGHRGALPLTTMSLAGVAG